MPSSIPESNPFAYRPFAAQPLLLNAPRIAGLLPAHATSEPVQAPVNTVSFTFQTELFEAVPESARLELFAAAQFLLSESLRYLGGALEESDLFDAETKFHERLTVAHPRQPPVIITARDAAKPQRVAPYMPFPTKAEMDAEIRDMLSQIPAHMAQARAEAEARIAERHRQQDARLEQIAQEAANRRAASQAKPAPAAESEAASDQND